MLRTEDKLDRRRGFLVDDADVGTTGRRGGGPMAARRGD